MAFNNFAPYRITRKVLHRIRYIDKDIYKARLKRLTLRKKDFIDSIKSALDENKSYASGKLGYSEELFMYYPILLGKKINRAGTQTFENELFFHFLNQEGLFPGTPSFMLDFAKFYVEQIRKLDFLGLCFVPRELEILKHYQLKNKFVYLLDQEPDRSTPDNPEKCYLQYFRDKKILIICPFAGILKERATREIFEGVWSRTGKKWFYPASIDALEFPYGFSKETQKRYATALDLLDSIKNEIAHRDFDVALIAAAGLAIPIAAYAKDIGKMGICLGGHLQAVFGVIGKRWWNMDDWKRDYFNSYWINVPERYKPRELSEGMAVCDNGDYW
jgi:hypothetical protein